MKKLLLISERKFKALNYLQIKLWLAVIIMMTFTLQAYANNNVTWLSENYYFSSQDVFMEGLMVVHDVSAGEGYINDGTKFGFIDVTGKVVIPLIYDSCAGFHEGLSVISINSKYGFIDKLGNEVIKPIYDYCFKFSEGVARVEKDDKYGFIDKKGKEILPIIYKHASDFKDGIAAVTNENNKIAFIDKTGKVLVETEYNDYLGNNVSQFNEGLCPVYRYNPETSEIKYGFIDTTGKLVIDTIYSDYGMIGNPYIFIDGVSRVFIEDETEFYIKYIDKTGKFVANPKENKKYINIDYKDDKYGIEDKMGNIIIPYIYDIIYESDIDILVAAKDNKCGAIDKNGKEIIPFIYDNISNYSEGVILVRKDNKVGIINDLQVIQSTMANPTSSKVIVNGNYVTFEAYNIEGNNYFKLRDLAMALNGTNKQFDVSWDSEKNAINLISNKAYTVTSGELKVANESSDKVAKKTTSSIYADNKKVDFKAYNIEGNNYFKLRDIMKIFNIGVTWDGENNTIRIDSQIEYTE